MKTLFTLLMITLLVSAVPAQDTKSIGFQYNPTIQDIPTIYIYPLDYNGCTNISNLYFSQVMDKHQMKSTGTYISLYMPSSSLDTIRAQCMNTWKTKADFELWHRCQFVVHRANGIPLHYVQVRLHSGDQKEDCTFDEFAELIYTLADK